MTKTIEQEALDNPPAFPAGWPEAGYEPHYGMILRDWFAGQALVGMLASEAGIPPYANSWAAERAYQMADAMLAARGLKLVEVGDDD